MIGLVEATALHIPHLAETMRSSDVREAAAMGKAPAAALRHGLLSSVWALTALEDGVPVAMLGVSPKSTIEGIGVPWMLGSDRVYDNARSMLKLAPGVFDEMRATFPRLENYVSIDNERALRFLKRWNWQISSDVITVRGVQFVRFF